jgi:serine/threonine protein phosphatase PrpC
MDNDVPVAAVADGAGAVALGKVGATMAVYTATTTVCARQQSAAWPESDSDWHECLVEAVHAAQATLAAEARARQVTVREFATTLILAVATPELVAVVQIGDGAVVVGDQEGNLLSLTVPQNGEYANETTFLSSPNALATAQVCVAWYASACDGLL